MSFEKYQHVERYDKSDCAGLLEGLCYIFPKIDGTNASVWLESAGSEGIASISPVIGTGSRKRNLTEGGSDNAGFRAYINGSGREVMERFFSKFPKYRLFGEWLVPHTIKGYRDNAWNKFYVFDVMDGNGNYVPYDQYTQTLDNYGIEYIPAIAVIQNPTPERLLNIAKSNTYLLEDGEVGEGIVIKRYDFVNRYGRVTWGKLVLNEFKDKMSKSSGPRVIQETKSAAERIVESYVTKSLVDKELAKILNNEPNVEKKRLIPMLFNFVWDDLMGEMKNIAKEFKKPILDFKQLHYHMCNKIRETQPEIFS